MNEAEAIIRNRREELMRVQHAVDQLAAQCHLPAQVVGDMQVALDEIVTNIMDYGYDDNGEHEIRIFLKVLGNILEATVEDDGAPFNPLGIGAPDTRSALRDRKIGGVGIHFVKNLMSEVTYDRIGDRNRLVLRKKLTG